MFKIQIFLTIFLKISESRRGDDACQSHPCLHSGLLPTLLANMGTIWSYSVNLPGECIALNDGGYRCECTGTGYHGETCHKGGLTFLPKNEFPSRETRWQVVVVAWFYSRNLLFILFPNTPQHYNRFQYSVLN